MSESRTEGPNYDSTKAADIEEGTVPDGAGFSTLFKDSGRRIRIGKLTKISRPKNVHN